MVWIGPKCLVFSGLCKNDKMPANTRNRNMSNWWIKFKRCWPKLLFKRRSRLALYLTLLTIIILQLYTNITQPRRTTIQQQRYSRYRAIISRLQHLRYQVKMLTFKFAFREHINAVTIRKYKLTNGLPTLPATTFTLSSQDRLQQWPIVISVRCSLENFRYFLESLREGLIESKTSVICIFALTCQARTGQWDVTSMINDFESCSVKFIFNVSTESVERMNVKFRRRRHRSIEELQKAKLQWWYFINRFFQSGVEEGVLFDGILKNFKQDVLFVDSEVVLSSDFLQVATHARKMKASLPEITQFSLGTLAGQNLINAHPDTFVVRKSRDYHGLVYGMNFSNWETLSNIQERFLEDLNPVWTESVGDAVSGGLGIRSIVPTLSRYWLISPPITSGLAHPSFPPWLFSSQSISNVSTVNVGIRDSLGFLCGNRGALNDGTMKNAICYCSFWIWQKTKVHVFPRCFPQANDDCLDSY